MKNLLNNLLLLSLMLLFFAYDTQAQCTSLIDVNKKIGGTHILHAKRQTLVVRGNYTYSIQIINTEKGVMARVISKGGVEFNQDDEVIFMD